MVLPLVVMAISSISLYISLDAIMERALFSSHIRAKELSELFLPVVVKTNIVTIVVLLVIILFLSFFFIGKINDSLMGMKRNIEKIGALDFSSQEHLDRYEAVSDAVNAYEKMVVSLRGRAYSLSVSVRNLSGIAEKMVGNDVDIADAKRELKSIKETLNHFD